LTYRAFRATRGLVGGVALLFVALSSTLVLTACGAPQYTYAADSAASTYYKVPYSWHQISQKDLGVALSAQGLPTSGIWSAAFDADSAPSINHDGAINLSQPFVLAEVIPLSSTASNELSYNMMRDLWLPVTSTTRQAASSQGFAGTNFTQLRDQTITAGQGVHGVRETFQYTFGQVTDTFDEDVLTNADQTTVYVLEMHCTNACYSQNQNAINTVMSSFTVGSPT
jgi:hypothetical protein